MISFSCRPFVRLFSVFAAVTLAQGCGDGDGPIAPPPDPPRPTTVAVTPATAELSALGATVQLTAGVRDQNGRPMASATITWGSGNASIATVDAAGLVTAASNGTATITATAGPASGSATVTVTQAPDSVEVSPAAATITALGDTLRLAAEAVDANGHAVAGAEFSWESSADSVATVDAGGLVTAVAEGVAAITASAGEASGSAEVTVMQPVASVEVSPAADTIGLGSTLKLMAEGFDEDGEVVDAVEFSWESSDTAVASVDASGLVRGVAVGVTTITASAGSGEGTTEITVMDLERAALVALYEATDGPNWVNNENWLTDAPLGEWFGVETNRGRVVTLAMSYWDPQTEEWVSNNVVGPIPPELGDLTSLQYVQFYNNNLTGPIPPELGALANLTTLDFNANELSGSIPAELGSLTNLTSLNLYGNDLTGPIPAELGGLANLKSLRLGANDLTGSIPQELGNLAHLTSLNLGGNSLTGPIPPVLGSLADLERLYLWGNDLTGPIPPVLGSLANLTRLSLSLNNLTGPIPPELGSLVNLERLWLRRNDLEGPIPESLLALDALERFHFEGNADLCAPGTIDFVTWLEGIEDTSGPYCNESDAGALNQLYETAGGPDWTNSDGWLETAALEAWYGVTTNSLGMVTALDLTRNGLSGRLPATLGELAQMTELRIAGNPDLSGRLPLSLDRLALRTLHYAGTGLCAPVYTSFRDWLGAIPSHEGTDAECAPLTDRNVLVALYEATGGRDWADNEDWLTDTPLEDWHGVYTDGLGRVVELDLYANRLEGRIPAELGELASLEVLNLYRNGLTGPVPSELGNLAELQRLSLGENNLTGAIPSELGSLANLGALVLNENDLAGRVPPELGNLSGLWKLNLSANGLAGAIPSELGQLASLRSLNLSRNNLTGSVPSELGNLANLWRLNLAANRLTDSVPSRLGNLANLEELYLGNNDLTGPVPPEFGGLTNLRRLAVQTNAGMAGPLPTSLTNLATLEVLQAGGTDLCAPPDTDFLEWLEGVPNRWVAPCEGELGAAYLVQTVQSWESPVPLVAGEEALLRVFPTASQVTGEGIPAVRARFFVDGRETHVENIPAKSSPIPTGVDESSLSTSTNATIPGRVVQPGLEMVIEVDPNGTLDPSLGVVKRIPEMGRLAVDVRDMPLFDVTVIPFLWTEEPDSAVIETAADMEANPGGHELLAPTRSLLPVGGLAVTAHEPVRSSSNYAYDLMEQTQMIRVMEGGAGYYWGTLSGDWNGPALGNGAYQNIVSGPWPNIIAHEFGHAMSLPHAPCGGARNPDPAYPTPDGTIGVWGYDFGTGRLVPPTSDDIMGYCDYEGIADYFFTKALEFRLSTEVAAARPSPTPSLLLWGGASGDGELHLNPAFVVDAPPALPDSAGEYSIAGHSADGGELFSLSFTMPETADGDGSSGFVFAVPVRPGWEEILAAITLSGPGGSVRLDGETDLPMAILRDPASGRVRAILRDLPPATKAAMDVAGRAGGPQLDVLFSRGIPDAVAWQR